MDFSYELLVYFGFFAFAGILSIFYWRAGFFFFLTYIFFEDAIRMKFFNNNVAIQIAKDFLLIGIYIGCFIYKRSEFKYYKFLTSVFILSCYQLLNIFNPRAISMLAGFASLRANFFYFPILWIAAIYFSNPKNLSRYLMFSFLIVSMICAIAFIQVLTGHEIWWNFFGHYDPLVSFSFHAWTDENVFRPFGIFNNSGRFMHLLFIYYFYVLLMWSLQDIFFSKNQKKMFFVLAVPFFAGFIYSANRTSFFVTTIVTVIFILQIKGISTKELFKQITLRRFAFLILILMVFLVSSNLFRDQLKRTIEFISRSLIPGHKEYEVSARADSSWSNVTFAIKESGFIGHGTGTNSLGINYLGIKGYKGRVESGYAVMIWEFGYIGLFLWLYLWFRFLQFFAYLRRKNINYCAININYLAFLFILSFLAAFSVGFQTFQSWIFNILLWNFFGIIIALNKITPSYLQEKNSISDSIERKKD